MNVDDIRQIITAQLVDVGIVPEEIHFEIALDYYNQIGEIPELNYIIDKMIQNNDGVNLEIRDRMASYLMSSIAPNAASIEIVNHNDADENDQNDENGDNSDSGESEEPFTYSPSIANSNSEENISQLFGPNSRELDVKNVIADIDSISLIMIKDPVHIVNNNECLLCYDKFVNTDIVRVLPCMHNFHRRCIDEHLIKESHLCPLCRQSAGKYKQINI